MILEKKWIPFFFVEKKNEFHCFCCCHPTVSHRVMDHFYGIINSSILHTNGFSSVPNLYLFLQLSAEKKFKFKVTEMNGYNS